MESTYEALAQRAMSLLSLSQSYRIIIVLIGTPGSGKSTVLQRVCEIINDKYKVSVVNKPDTHQRTQLVEDFVQLIPEHPPVKDIESEKFVSYKNMASPGQVEIYGKGGSDTRLTIEEESKNVGDLACVVPMDGFHLTRAQLHTFKDPERAILRRGSSFTFDNTNLVTLVQFLKKTTQTPTIPIDQIYNLLPSVFVPSFNHSLKDPVPNEIEINGGSRIVILEGLYLLLQEPGWEEISQELAHPRLSDKDIFINTENGEISSDLPLNYAGVEFWKIHIDPALNLRRVAERHVKTGLANSIEEGEKRFKINDEINGEILLLNSAPCDINVHTIQE